jgi:alkylation response protein AidB-like acyl-CoA dehydrogenase
MAVDRPIAVSALFEALGESNATSSALDEVLSSLLLAPGRSVVAVALPPLRTCDAPARIEGSQVTINGLGTEALWHHDDIAVVARDQAGHTSFVVATSALKLDTVRGLDPDLGLVEVTGSLERRSLSENRVVDWGAATAVGQLALGHELVGTARTMLELARVHALERMQFGHPIASFQAVRHRLAESLVAIEAAAALLAAAWDEPDPVIAAMAKATAGRSARTVARHCQQVLAGIGFTTEHSFHRYFRRTVLLDQLLGAGSELTHRLGSEALVTGSLPVSFPL